MSKRTVEFIKSVILVILFVCTILLLYLVFDDSYKNEPKFVLPSQAESTQLYEDSKNMISPSRVIISKGDGSYTFVASGQVLYSRSLTALVDVSAEYTMLCSEISEDEYIDLKDNYSSIEYVFGYDVPFSEFCDVFGIGKDKSFAAIGNMSAYCFSSNAKDCVLVADETGNRYYKILSDAHDDDNIFDRINTSNFSSGDKCISAKEAFGIGTDALVPVEFDRSIAETEYDPDILIEDSYVFSKLSEKIFGNEGGFVRRVSDEFGNVTYMYGYGLKTLNISSDLIMEYKEEISGGSSKGFFDDLQKALDFDAMVAYYLQSFTDTELVLAKTETEIDQKDVTRKFYFRQRLAGAAILGEDIPSIEIYVRNGKIAYYRCNSLSAKRSDSNENNIVDARDALMVCGVNVYRQHLLDIGADTTQPFTEDTAFTYIVRRLKNISICYLKSETTLVPSWRIELDDGSVLWTGLRQNLS